MTLITDPRHRRSSFFNVGMHMTMTRMKRAAAVLLVIWIVAIYLFISPLRCAVKDSENAEIHDKFIRLSKQMEALKQQHNGLVDKIKQAGVSESLHGVLNTALLLEADRGPSQEHEELKNRVYSNIKEIWYYVNSELSKVMSLDSKIEKIQEIIAETGHRKRSLLSDMKRLQEADGYQEWRSREAANVSDLIQRRLKHLQNPADCKEARKVMCNLNKGCGFGCQLHHIVYCLIFAYATERTLILNSKGWRYNPKGWDYAFYPVSDNCTSLYGDKVVPWPANYDAKVVSLPFIDSIARKPKFLPLAVPADLAKRIIRFNGDPSSWWIGQLVKFVLRPRPQFQTEINRTRDKMNVIKPFVGVHIRRTDKVGTEAAFHHINEYMTHVKDYYDQLELTTPVDVRRVYLASDDDNVLADARSKFPSYKFYGDPSISSVATHKRYSPLSLTGLLVDLYLLAESDYLVCTFSSQVGRVAYEMMQTNRVDASDSFYSLDDIYYFGGQNAHDRRAVLPHTAHGDTVGFEVDDLIGVAGNHYNGYGRGTNKKTNQNGLIPWYKTVDYLVLFPFPEYKQVPLYVDNKHTT